MSCHFERSRQGTAGGCWSCRCWGRCTACAPKLSLDVDRSSTDDRQSWEQRRRRRRRWRRRRLQGTSGLRRESDTTRRCSVFGGSGWGVPISVTTDRLASGQAQRWWFSVGPGSASRERLLDHTGLDRQSASGGRHLAAQLSSLGGERRRGEGCCRCGVCKIAVIGLVVDFWTEKTVQVVVVMAVVFGILLCLRLEQLRQLDIGRRSDDEQLPAHRYSLTDQGSRASTRP